MAPSTKTKNYVIWLAPWGAVSLNLPGALKRENRNRNHAVDGYIELAKGPLEECREAIAAIEEEGRRAGSNLSKQEMATLLRILEDRRKRNAAFSADLVAGRDYPFRRQ
jgi:hypothetical protein